MELLKINKLVEGAILQQKLYINEKIKIKAKLN